MLLYTLLAAIAVIVAIFLTPLRHKVWVAVGVIATLAITATSIAIKAIVEGSVHIATLSTPLFGEESFAVDKLSALFLIIISIAFESHNDSIFVLFFINILKILTFICEKPINILK